MPTSHVPAEMPSCATTSFMPVGVSAEEQLRAYRQDQERRIGSACSTVPPLSSLRSPSSIQKKRLHPSASHMPAMIADSKGFLPEAVILRLSRRKQREGSPQLCQHPTASEGGAAALFWVAARVLSLASVSVIWAGVLTIWANVAFLPFPE